MQPKNLGATTREFKLAIEPETGTEGTFTYTIWRGSIHGVSAADAEAAVNAETTSALDLIGVAEICETLQEQH